jgi:hypothetical protein
MVPPADKGTSFRDDCANGGAGMSLRRSPAVSEKATPCSCCEAPVYEWLRQIGNNDESAGRFGNHLKCHLTTMNIATHAIMIAMGTV